MRWRSLLLTIILNIFFMLFFTVIMEYTNLVDRYVSLEDTVSLAVDAALNSSVGSEEMFSDEFQAMMSSRASAMNVSAKTNASNVYSSALVYTSDDNAFHEVNIYELAKWCSDHDYRLPSSGDLGSVNNSFLSGNKTKGIFEWLFGDTGSDYSNVNLAWANRSTTKIEEYGTMSIASRHSGDMSDDFKSFYDNIGRKQQTVGYLKQRDGGGNKFKLVLKTYPVLYNMGFADFGGECSTSSNVTFDNFTSSIHVGKSYRTGAAGSHSFGNTLYFLTPASLGVTYVPTKVFKAAVINNLNTFIRLKGISGASTGTNSVESFKQCTGCIDTSVYTNGGSTHVEHTNQDNIVNDGLVEYDLGNDSVKVRVDYFFVDFKSFANAGTVVAKLNGQISKAATMNYASGSVDYIGADQNDLRMKTCQSFLNQDSAFNVNDTNTSGAYNSAYSSISGQRIVAKVTVKLKIHVPYKSSVIQWACQRFCPGGDPKHFSMKLYDPDTGTVDLDNDDTWYSYSTYFMQSRV